MSKSLNEAYGYGGLAEDEIAYFMTLHGRVSESPWYAVSQLYFHYPEMRDEYDGYGTDFY